MIWINNRIKVNKQLKIDRKLKNQLLKMNKSESKQTCASTKYINLRCKIFSVFGFAEKISLVALLVATQNFADGRIREWQKSLEPLSISSSNCHPLGDPILILLSQKELCRRREKENFANCYPATPTTHRRKTI